MHCYLLSDVAEFRIFGAFGFSENFEFSMVGSHDTIAQSHTILASKMLKYEHLYHGLASTSSVHLYSVPRLNVMVHFQTLSCEKLHRWKSEMFILKLSAGMKWNEQRTTLELIHIVY